MTKFQPNDRVFIFETVTGNEFGERATVVEYREGEQVYIVRGADGALFTGAENQLRPLNLRKEN